MILIFQTTQHAAQLESFINTYKEHFKIFVLIKIFSKHVDTHI